MVINPFNLSRKNLPHFSGFYWTFSVVGLESSQIQGEKYDLGRA